MSSLVTRRLSSVSAIIVGRYSDPVTGGEAAKVVENLGDYLTGVGY